jgi:hypothetical protein
VREYNSKIDVLVSDSSPPQRPPQISPDGKWVWDGTEWQPVAGRDSGRQAVFPAFSQAALDSALMGAEPAPRQVEAPSPVMNYPVDYTNPQSLVPLWQRQAPRVNKYVVYGAVGAVVLVMAMIFLNSLGTISWPWSSDGPVQAVGTPGPAPPVMRSDYAVANRFLAGFLSPALAQMNKTTAAQRLSCNGVLTVGCQSALIESDNQVKNMLSVVQNAPTPVCIAPNVARFKVDLTAMDAALQVALQSYNDNSKSELVKGLGRFYSASARMQVDLTAIGNARTAYCDTQLTGP